MVKYVLKRLGYILVTLWIIITCTFFLMKNLPSHSIPSVFFMESLPQTP